MIKREGCLEHVPCVRCTSSDGLAVYYDDKREFNGFCWVCKESMLLDHVDGEYIERKLEVREKMQLSKYSIDDVLEFPVSGWTARNIDKSTHELFGVKAQGRKGEGPHEFYYPNYRDGKLVGYKIRSKFKEGDKEVEKGKVEVGTFKCFRGYVGDNKKGIELFGQNLHETAPKRVFILGGQEDAMSAYQIVRDNVKMDVKKGDLVPGYGFVSPQNGENDADIKLQINWFDTAQEIILCFDNDEAGKQCTEAVSQLFPASKVKIMSLRGLDVKDTNQALMEGKGKEWWYAIWNAKPYSPAGITNFSDALVKMRDRGNWKLIPFPKSFGKLNELTLGGWGYGEILNIIGSTSIGKSSITNEMVFEAIRTQDCNIGVITLEADSVEYAEQMHSLALNTRLITIPHEERDWEAIEAVHNSLFEDKVYLIEDMGSMKGEKDFWDKVNFLVNGLNCKIIIFDPATLGVKSARMDEQEFLSDLVPFVKRHKVAWVNVCHTRKSSNEQQSASKGKQTVEEDLKGASDWGQNAMINLTISRDKMNDNPIIRNTTQICMPKCRRNGAGTGIAGYVQYNVKTGRLEEGEDPGDDD